MSQISKQENARARANVETPIYRILKRRNEAAENVESPYVEGRGEKQLKIKNSKSKSFEQEQM